MGNLILARIESRQNSRLANHSWKRLFVRAAWAIVIGVELFLLLDDITLFRSPKSELPETTGERVAEIRSVSSGVRWQSPKDILWNEGQPGQVLFAGQSLMTLAGSEARLVFDTTGTTAGGGRPAGSVPPTVAPTEPLTELRIGEKTLIQLSTPSAGAENPAPILLSLSRGTVRANTARAITLISGEFQIQVDPGTQFEAKMPEGGKTIELEVTAGRVHSGDKLKITSGEKLVLPVEKISPATLERKAEPVPRIPVEPVSLPTGASALPPPRMRAPILRSKPRVKDQTNFIKRIFDGILSSAEADEADLEIELGWEPVPGATAYQVQISKTKNFQRVLVDEKSGDPTYTWAYRPGMENAKGRVFYRIGSIGADGKVGTFSKPLPLVLRREKVAIITPPPATPVAPLPAVTEKSAAGSPVKISTAESKRVTRISAAALLSGYAQSSDASLLRDAKTTSPYFHEAFAWESRGDELLFSTGATGSSLRGSDTALPKSRRFRANARIEKNTGRRFLGGGVLYAGLGLELDARFQKESANVIGLHSGLSTGPTLSFSPTADWNLGISLPLSGTLLSGFLAGPYGIRMTSDTDFTVARYSDLRRICITFSLSGNRYYWKNPSGTSVTEWNAGAGPSYIF